MYALIIKLLEEVARCPALLDASAETAKDVFELLGFVVDASLLSSRSNGREAGRDKMRGFWAQPGQPQDLLSQVITAGQGKWLLFKKRVPEIAPKLPPEALPAIFRLLGYLSLNSAQKMRAEKVAQALAEVTKFPDSAAELERGRAPAAKPPAPPAAPLRYDHFNARRALVQSEGPRAVLQNPALDAVTRLEQVRKSLIGATLDVGNLPKPGASELEAGAPHVLFAWLDDRDGIGMLFELPESQLTPELRRGMERLDRTTFATPSDSESGEDWGDLMRLMVALEIDVPAKERLGQWYADFTRLSEDGQGLPSLAELTSLHGSLHGTHSATFMRSQVEPRPGALSRSYSRFVAICRAM